MAGPGSPFVQAALRRMTPAVPLLWSPIDLGAKLVVLMDGEDPSTMVIQSGLVSQWVNKVAQGAVLQSISALQPVFDPIGFNKRPAVVFDGTDDLMGSANASFVEANAMPREREYWVLSRNDEPGSSSVARYAFNHGGSTNTAVRIGRTNVGSENRSSISVGTGAAAPVANSPTIETSGIHVQRLALTATTAAVSVDNSAPVITNIAQTSGNSGIVRIGTQSANTTIWKGAVNCVLITAPLTADESVKLLAYLKTRGGIP